MIIMLAPACRIKILATLVLPAALLSTPPCVRADQAAESRTGFESVALPPRPGFDGQPYGLKSCRNAVQYSPDTTLVFCEASRFDTRNNFGLRLFLVRSAQGQPRIAFAAPEGGGDAYSAKVMLFRSTSPLPDAIRPSKPDTQGLLDRLRPLAASHQTGWITRSRPVRALRV